MFDLYYDADYIHQIDSVLDRRTLVCELVSAINTVAEENNDSTLFVHPMEEFNAIFAAYTPYDIVQATYDDFILQDDYFTIDARGVAHSFNDPRRSDEIDLGAVIFYMLDHNDDLGMPDVRKILDRRAQDMKEGEDE